MGGRKQFAISKAKFNNSKLKLKQTLLNSTPRSSQSSHKSSQNPSSQRLKPSSQSPLRALKYLAAIASSECENESASKPASPPKAQASPPKAQASPPKAQASPPKVSPIITEKESLVNLPPASSTAGPTMAKNAAPSENYEEIMNQLEKISISKNLDPKFLEEAQRLLAQFEAKPLTFSHSNTSKLLTLQEDSEALKVLSKCEKTFRKWRPIYTTPDGNCVFNAIVLYLKASFSLDLVRKLRIAVVAELVFHERSYYRVLREFCKTTDEEFIGQEVHQEMRAACKMRGWCGYVSFAALATVLGCPIRLVHPIYSVSTESGYAFNPHSMNAVLLPIRGESKLETVHILACGNADDLLANPSAWRSNHFVLLVDPLATPTASPISSQHSINLAPAPLHPDINLSSIPEVPTRLFYSGSDNASVVCSLLCPPSPSANSKSLSNLSNTARDSSSASSGSAVYKQLQFNSVIDKFENPYLMCTYPLLVDPIISPAAIGESVSKAEPSPKKVISDSEVPLLPGAHLLIGESFLSSQAIFDILSEPNVAARSVDRIPNGPKSNCYFILHVGTQLTEHANNSVNRMKMQDRLRDGTGGWDEYSVSNACYFSVENGILKSVLVNFKKNVHSHYDLRAHRANYTYKRLNDIPSRKCVFWFWNSEFSPAPGFVIVSYLGPPYSPRPHGNAKKSFAPYDRASHEAIAALGQRHQEKTLNVYADEMLLADSKNTTPPRNRQQVASAQHRMRKMYGIARSSINSSNFATVSLSIIFLLILIYLNMLLNM